MTARPSPTNVISDDTCEREARIKRLCEAMDHARGQNRMYRALLDRIKSEADTFKMALDATTNGDDRNR